MADSKNSKISELIELTDPSNADFIPIVDTANQETKKISYSSLIAALNTDDDSYSKADIDALIASGMWYYADQGAFPAAANNHGRVVHSHADGSMYYAHSGAWHKIENEVEAAAARAVIQADVDKNESDADTAIAALQADVDQNESDADTAIAALQADVNQNESDADTAIATLQADVDQNESDADTAIAAVQADVNQNESDADAALLLKAPLASPTFTGGFTKVSGATHSRVLLENSNTDFAKFEILEGKLKIGIDNGNGAAGYPNANFLTADVDSNTGGKVVLDSNVGSLNIKGERFILDNFTKTPTTATGATSIDGRGFPDVRSFDGANRSDTLANLCADPLGHVVKGSQEATWTFTRAQLNALTTTGTTLLLVTASPTVSGDNVIIVEDSHWLIKTDSSKTYAQTAVKLVCEIVNGQSIYKVATQITAANINAVTHQINQANGSSLSSNFGLYSRDTPQLDRISQFKNSMTIRVTGGTSGVDHFPDCFTEIRLKVKYRQFNSNTF